ncbi:MAG: 6-bladed beta-propeller [Bacillota bacterium]
MNNEALETRPAGRQIKREHVIIAALVIALLATIFFAWMFLRKTNPMETIKAAVMPIKPPRWVATIYGEGNVFLQSPRKVSVFGNRIYVSDTANHRVVVFDYNGHYVRKFGDTGDQKNRLMYPYGVAVIGKKVYVVDAGLSKVAVFNQNGRFERYFGEKVLQRPVDVAFYQNRLFFTDVGRQQVVALNLSGKEVLSIGKYGTGGSGDFYYPNGLAVAPDGRILVADTNNSRVQVFDAKGKFLEMWTGNIAKQEGFFASPSSITLDKKGNAYVADPLCQRVSILDPKGKLVYASQEVGPPDNKDSLALPTGVWVDGKQRLYVADYGNSRVVIYDLK